MLKLICLIVLLIGCKVGNATILSDYFDLINEAELLICNDKFSEAMQHYDKAFDLKNDEFGRDVYNAWICSYLMDDEKRFRKYSVNLLEKGSFKTQTMYVILNPVPGGPSVEKFQGIFQNLKAFVRSEVDSIYKIKLDGLVESDQPPRQYFIAQCGGKYNICGRDSLNRFDSVNVLKLKAQFDEDGFATEKKIGFQNGIPTYAPVFDLILRHDRSWNNRKTLDSFLYSRVMAGEYHPQDYALLKDQSYGNAKDSISQYQQNTFAHFATDLFSVINKQLYITEPKSYRLTKTNATRKSIYLEPLGDMIVKARFQFLHPYFHFLNDWFLAEWDNVPDDQISRIVGQTLTTQQIDDLNTIRKRRCKHGLHH